MPLDRGVPPARRQARGARPAKRARQERRSAVPRVRNGSPRIPCTTAPCKPAIARRRPPASPCLFGHGNGIEENFRYITVADDGGSEIPFQGETIARINAKSRISGVGRELSDGRSRRFGNISGKNCESITVAQSLTPSCRAACPPAGHCPNLGNRRLPALGARAARRRGAGEARRSGRQKTAGMAIPPDRERGIPWSAGPPSQMPGGLPQALGRARGAPAPDGHGHPLLRMRLLQPRPNLSGEGSGDAVCGPRAFFEFTGVPLGLGDQVPDAATPLKIRRGARSRMPRSPRRRAPQETRRAGEIRRPARPGRGGTGTPATRPLSAWTPEAARCTRSGLPPPTSTTSSSPAPSCGRTARFATPARDTRARATRPGLPAASPA